MIYQDEPEYDKVKRIRSAGKEKDDSFKGSTGTIYQSFPGKDAYITFEEKAAN